MKYVEYVDILKIYLKINSIGFPNCLTTDT